MASSRRPSPVLVALAMGGLVAVSACASSDDDPSPMQEEEAAPSCTDGLVNGGETAVDCGGPCPRTFSGAGCTSGTEGSMVCTTYTSGDTFTVMLSWNASGGNAYVNYGVAYNAEDEFNTLGIRGGVNHNICTSGTVTETFELPLDHGYSYKIWRAYCVRDDACDGCGEDAVIAEGGPFGVAADCY